MPTIHLLSLNYLVSGTDRQRQAYKEISHARIFEILSGYRPVLAGTIPLDIDIEESDLDVICETHDLLAFQKSVQTSFGQFPFFRMTSSKVRGVDTIIASFQLEKLRVELFCQTVKVTSQYAVIHLLVEQRLLELGGENMKSEIRALKRQGMKTEPAFAHYLGLVGDPYDALALLANRSDQELATLIARRK